MISMLSIVFVLAMLAVAAAAAAVDHNLLFDPTDLENGAIVLPSHPRSLSQEAIPQLATLAGGGPHVPPSFNPAVAVLPSKLRSRISHAWPTARFVATVMHNPDQCATLMPNATFAFHRDHPDVPSTASVLLLDEDLSPVAATRLHLQGGGPQVYLQDIRVHTHEDVIVVTYIRWMDEVDAENWGKPIWGIGVLQLGGGGPRIASPGLHATVSESILSEHESIKKRATGFGELKNVGVVYNNSSEAGLLYWIQPTLDIRFGSELSNSGAPRRGAYLVVDDIVAGKRATMHNSIDPILLPDGKTMLAIGHTHADLGTGTYWGNTYLHYFFLIDAATDAYNVLAHSKPFCFPSLTNALLCDTIQFASSAALSTTKESLIIAYGVNDCQASMVHLSLSEVLDAMVSVETRPLKTDLHRHLQAIASDSDYSPSVAPSPEDETPTSPQTPSEPTTATEPTSSGRNYGLTFSMATVLLLPLLLGS